MEQYFVYSEMVNNYLSIPSRLLYNLWDRHKEVVIEGNSVSRKVPTKDYTAFHCDSECRVAKFKAEEKQNILDAFRLKLLKDYQIHHEWFNSLYDVWISDEFIVTLKKVAALRATKNITPAKEDMFNFLKNKIEHTILPATITSDSGDIWKWFLDKCKEIQEEYMKRYVHDQTIGAYTII